MNSVKNIFLSAVTGLVLFGNLCCMKNQAALESWTSTTKSGQQVSFRWCDFSSDDDFLWGMKAKNRIEAKAFSIFEPEKNLHTYIKEKFLKQAGEKYSQLNDKFISWWKSFDKDWAAILRHEKAKDLIKKQFPKKFQHECPKLYAYISFIEDWSVFIEKKQYKTPTNFMRNKFLEKKMGKYKSIDKKFLTWWKSLTPNWKKWVKKELIVRFEQEKELIEESKLLENFTDLIPKGCTDTIQCKAFMEEWILFIKKFVKKLVKYNVLNGISEGRWLIDGPSEKIQFSKQFIEINRLLLIASIDGKPVGFSSFSKPSSDQNAFLELIAITPAAQGEGLSDELIFSIPAKKISLVAINQKAFDIYIHQGFKPRNGSMIFNPENPPALCCSGQDLYLQKKKLEEKRNVCTE